MDMDNAYHADQMAEALAYLLKASEQNLSHVKSVAATAITNYEEDQMRRGLKCRYYFVAGQGA
jgi:hypothetical protein